MFPKAQYRVGRVNGLRDKLIKDIERIVEPSSKVLRKENRILEINSKILDNVALFYLKRSVEEVAEEVSRLWKKGDLKTIQQKAAKDIFFR